MTRSGDDFLRSLRDGRSVFLDGERVESVAEHPALAGAAASIAHLYDIAQTTEDMTFPWARNAYGSDSVTDNPSGGGASGSERVTDRLSGGNSIDAAARVNMSFLIPRSRADLVARRVAHKRWADASYGLLGRSPDHVASLLTGLAAAAPLFGQFASNVTRFHERAALDDLYLAYAIVHPTIDRQRPAHQQAEPNLYASVVKERADGIIIRGAQMLATAGVFADFIFISVILPLKPGDEDYAFSVVVPTSAAGLKLYARRAYAAGATSVFDYPLSARFDETDSLVVLDDVFVPWEHVFVYRDIERTFAQFSPEMPAHVLSNTQAQARFWSKLQFLIGLVHRCMIASGQAARPEVQVQLGDLAARAALVEGLVLAAEAEPVLDRWGVMRPNPRFLYANQTVQSSLYPEVVQMVREMLSGSLLQLPSSVHELQRPETLADMQRYVRWPEADGVERIKLLKLVWDMVGSEFAGRHVQYEMFYAGQPAVVKMKANAAYDWDAAERLVQCCLDSYGVEGALHAPTSV